MSQGEKPVTIIMVEDDEGHARLIEKNIRRAGVNNEIIAFVDGSSALDFLLGPDGSGEVSARRQLLVLLDLNLPDMTGVDILAKIKSNSHLKRSPVVVLTTTDDSREIQRCYDLGANVYITKPVNYEGFANAIRQLGLFFSVIQVPENAEPAIEPVIRVLYVDDDLALVRLVQKALGRRGFEVAHAASGDEALAQIAAGGFHVVALDHYLASGTGLDFLPQLVDSIAALPVVYVTGSSETKVAVAALKAGAADFVPKTVGDDFLIFLGAALEQAVDKARLRAQKEAAEREVRKARDRAEVLLAEVNHRVANSLALVASLVSLQANAMTDQVAKAALDETRARIVAISLVHKRLYSSSDVRFVELDGYLSGLLDQLATSMQDEGHGASLTYDLEPLKLRTDASVSLGVVVTEWVTNAFKYAYPNRTGEVRVRLRQLPEEHVELTVEDDGIGRGEGSAKGTGLGTRIVKAMAVGMGAEIQYVARQPGTLARLIFPLQEN